MKKNQIFSVDYNNYPINRSYPTTAYNYHPNYATFPHPSPLFSTGTIPSMNKSYHPSSFDTISNLNHFYRRHSKKIKSMDLINIQLIFFSLLAESPSVYSSSTSNHPSSNPFNYSPEIFFGWNNGSSLMRTHSNSYQDYSGSRMK
jgi:hypothetical protein